MIIKPFSSKSEKRDLILGKGPPSLPAHINHKRVNVWSLKVHAAHEVYADYDNVRDARSM